MKNYLIVGFNNHPESTDWNSLNKINIKDYDLLILNLDNPSLLEKDLGNFGSLSYDFIKMLNASKTIVFIFNGIKSNRYEESYISYKHNTEVFPIFFNFIEENPSYIKNIADEKYKNYFNLVEKNIWYIELPLKIDTSLVSKFFEGQNFEVESFIDPIAFDNCRRLIALDVSYSVFYHTKSFSSSGRQLTGRKDYISKSGNLILLPSVKPEDQIKGINSLLIDVFKVVKVEEEPKWVKKLLVPGETELLEEIKKVTENKISLEKKLEKLNIESKKFFEIKKILYESGGELENKVKELLINMGIKFEKSKVSAEDLFVKTSKGNFVFEIKGVEGSFSIKGIEQLVRWVINLKDKNIEAKGIFIGNHFRKKPLEVRPNPFADNIVNYAKINQFLLLTTESLFYIYCEFKEKRISSIDFLKMLKNEIGVYKIK